MRWYDWAWVQFASLLTIIAGFVVLLLGPRLLVTHELGTAMIYIGSITLIISTIGVIHAKREEDY